MKQSRAMSFLESAINIVVGFGISFVAQLIFLPMLGVAIELHQNFIFALIMTAISLCRSFVLRRLFEALHIRTPISPAMQAVIAERRRQIEAEGWSADHDDKHAHGELARAGACYALGRISAFTVADGKSIPLHDSRGLPIGSLNLSVSDVSLWPWERTWWKPRDFRRNLVRAAALILAEIERFDRQRKAKTAHVFKASVGADGKVSSFDVVVAHAVAHNDAVRRGLA